MGIKADFKSWIPEAVIGNYGLKLTIITDSPEIITDDDEPNGTKEKPYIIRLDNHILQDNFPLNTQSKPLDPFQ